MLKKITENNIFWLLLILIFAVLQTRYLFLPGLHTFSDEAHIANLYEMIRALQSGQFPPRWAPDFSYNYGHPFFIFYYLLPYIVGSVSFFLFNSSLIWSLKISFILATILSGISMYFLANKFFKKPTAFAVSLIYLFTPYRAVDLYVRGAIGEIFAFAFIPLVLFSVINFLSKKTFRWFILSTFSIAGLIISHNLSLIIFFPVFLVLSLAYILIYFPKKHRWQSFVNLFLTIFTGISLCSFYLIPLVFEKKYIQSGTPFNPVDHFPFIKQLILPSWGYGASVWGPTDQMSFQIGLINLLGVIVALLTFQKTKHKKFILILLLIFFISVFMMNIRSYPIWQILPVSSYIQFPWRFLIVTTFVTPIIIGFLGQKKSLVLVFISILITFSYFTPHKINQVNDDYYLKRFFANQNTSHDTSQVSSEYPLNSEDYLPLTIWTSSRPQELPPPIESQPPISITNIKNPSPIHLSFTSISTASAVLKINKYYYPGWTATIDNKTTTLAPTDTTGRISLSLPSGQHQVDLNFKNTPLRTTSNVLSLITVVIIPLYYVYQHRRKN